MDDEGGTRPEMETGFPVVEHNQWTVEGEIERFGVFGAGVARARGWRRVVGLVMVTLILMPIVLSVLALAGVFR